MDLCGHLDGIVGRGQRQETGGVECARYLAMSSFYDDGLSHDGLGFDLLNRPRQAEPIRGLPRR